LIVTFWGTRGSLPTAITPEHIHAKLMVAIEGALERKLQGREQISHYIKNELPMEIGSSWGGNTSCLQLTSSSMPDHHLILDMGSGARPLGNALLAQYGPAHTYHILMSHMHWDHIMGFPFFTPAYLPNSRLIIYGCHAELERAFRRQQSPISFPVELAKMGSTIEFRQLEVDQWQSILDFNVLPKLQQHAGDSYGYRIEQGGKSLIYSTDSEHNVEDEAQRAGFVEFFDSADLVVFDTMYSLADSITMKANWGHSNNVIAVELCQQARVKCLCLFHHEPGDDDWAVSKLLADTRRLEAITRGAHKMEIIGAHDHLQLTL
jgi:phosphoribosyl 1,2-cyclic phosphodiesterase